MAAVKKIGGVARIKRELLKTLKRSEYSGRPFPTVSHQSRNPECAVAIRVGIHGCGVPSLKIKIPMMALRTRVPPGIRTFTTLVLARRAKRGAVKLRLRRQGHFAPLAIGFRFGVADIDRPRRLKRNIGKHCPARPSAIFRNPELRMADAGGGNPI